MAEYEYIDKLDPKKKKGNISHHMNNIRILLHSNRIYSITPLSDI